MWQAGTTFLTNWLLMTVSSSVAKSVVESDNITFLCSSLQSTNASWFGPDGSGQRIRYTNQGQTTILDSVPQKDRLHVQVVQLNYSQSNLTVTDVMKTDSGKYACNDGSQDLDTFNLNVTDPDETVYIIQDKQSVLPCPLTQMINNLVWFGPPGFIVYNSIGTTKLNIQGLPADFVSRLAVHPTTGALIINNTQRSDDNLYKCNVGTGASNYVKLTVLVSPQSPDITNTTENIGSGRRIVWATEDSQVTLVCQVSRGNPQSSVKWLRGGMTGSEVPARNSSQRNADGTYDVISTVIVMAKRSDDRVMYVCQAEHRTWPVPQNASVELYLYLKPGVLVMSDPGNLQENATLSSTCSTYGCRPAANITWTGAGIPSPAMTIQDQATETFNVTSTYKKTVTRQDNGATIQCTITHPALNSSLITSRNITVWFSPTNAIISNNTQVTEEDNLMLRCTTGVSNPAANITWKNGTIPLTGHQDVDQNGEYGGKVRYQELSILTTRYMDGNIITCIADNDRIPGNGIINTTALDVKYHPIATILNGSSITVFEGDISVKLVCSAVSKPVSSFMWMSGSSVLQSFGSPYENQNVYTITSISRTHFGAYNCTANNNINPPGQATISINVLFPPTSVSISNNIQVTEGDMLILGCTSGVSSPAANITWKNGTISLSSGQYVDHKGDYGGKVRYQEVSIFTTRYMDGNIITCIADNDRITGGRVINTTVLDVKFSPIVMVSISPRNLVTEGENYVMLRCTSWSKPTSNIQWTKRDQTLPISQKADADQNHLNFTIATVNRSHAGVYSCLADNGVNGSLHERQKSIELLVQYPPDMNITVSNVTTWDQKTTLVCSPHGYPDNYTFGLWQHSWPGFNRILRSLASDTTNKTATLELHNLTYEDSGIYTCQASNGIRVVGAGQEFMAQSVYILVKSAPKILNISENFGEGIGQSVPIQFDFYSNTDEKLSVTAKHSNSSDMSYQGTFQTVHLDSLTVQKFLVPAPGYRASLNINITSEEDFGWYNIEVENIVGSDVRSIRIMAKIENLSAKDDRTVAAVAGGLGAAVVVIIVIVVVLIILRRRRSFSRRKSCEDLNRELQEQEGQQSGLVDNPVYDSSGPVPATSTGDIGAEYAVVAKPKSTAIKVEENSNLYAQVNKANKKTKKGAAKGKDVKSTKGDVYENADLPIKKPNHGNVYEDSGTVENIYEDTDAAASSGRMVSKDGLHYADLMLPFPTIRNGKPVIRGIEDRTEYAEIAYGKRGDPLPDSDEEQEKSGAKEKTYE